MHHHKYREVIEIETDRPLEKPLTVVLASDLHVGYHNRKAELSRWVGLINAEKPDLVLFAGDILDGALRPARVWGYDEEFRRIAAPVYSCLGIMNTSLPVQRHPALTVAKPFPCVKLAFFHTTAPGGTGATGFAQSLRSFAHPLGGGFSKHCSCGPGWPLAVLLPPPYVSKLTTG